MHGGANRLPARVKAEVAGQAGQRPELHSKLAAPGHRMPAAEVASVRKLARGRQRGVHHGRDSRALVAAVDGEGAGPGGQLRRFFLQRSVADQQAEQVALRLRAGAAPSPAPRDDR